MKQTLIFFLAMILLNPLSFATEDVVAFVSTRNQPKKLEWIQKNSPGLGNGEEIKQLLSTQNYTELLKRVWSEKDPKKRLQFLEEQAKGGHVVLMYEYALEALRQNPTLEVFSSCTQPWIDAAAARTEQDLVCIDDPTASTAIESLMRDYLESAVSLIEDHYSLEQYQNHMLQNEEQMLIRIQEITTQALDSTKPLPSPKWLAFHGEKGEKALLQDGEFDQKRRIFGRDYIKMLKQEQDTLKITDNG